MIMDADPSLDHEGYAALGTNDFTATREEGGDASTFSIDVDTASYTNLRPSCCVKVGCLARKHSYRRNGQLFPPPMPSPARGMAHLRWRQRPRQSVESSASIGAHWYPG